MRGSCIAGFWTQEFSTIYMGKPVARRFRQMVRRIQDWLILISFGNRVYHLPKPISFNEKVWRREIRTSAWKFPTRKTRKIGECLFRRSVCFRNFPLKRRKQPETELMVSLAKHQSVLLVCFNGSYIQPCSSFMIHTRCHTSIWTPLWHPRRFFSFESP